MCKAELCTTASYTQVNGTGGRVLGTINKALDFIPSKHCINQAPIYEPSIQEMVAEDAIV